MNFIAKTLFGLEPLLAEELRQLGATDIRPMARAVAFSGNTKIMYRANLECRTAIRILQPFHHFKTKHDKHLYKKLRELDWKEFLHPGQTLAIDGVTQSKYITHSKYLALKMKDAIVDQLREEYPQRPDINVHHPDVRFNIHLSKDNVCTLSLDTSNGSLHKRGYRENAVIAPLSEVLGAGLVLLTGWNDDAPFADAMCGSGTIVCEAAMIAANIPAQWNRKEKFGFQKWTNFDAALWEEIKAEAEANMRTPKHPIYGFDKDFKAIGMARTNALAAGVSDFIEFKRAAFERLNKPEDTGVLVLNPPYDERIDIANINAFYQMMGDQFKQEWQGWTAWVISANLEALKRLGLRPSKKVALYNGQLQSKFHKYEMYSGSKKAKKHAS